MRVPRLVLSAGLLSAPALAGGDDAPKQVCTKSASADGSRAFVLTAGSWETDPHYRLTVVPLQLR